MARERGVRVRVEGLQEVRRALKRMNAGLRRRIVRRALRKGATPIAKAARAKAPRRTSLPARKRGKPLHQTIVVRAQRKRKGHDELSAKVTHSRDGAHGHLVEYGTGPRYQKRAGIAGAGKYVGIMPAQPYMRPAFDSQAQTALRVATDEIRRGVEKEMAR